MADLERNSAAATAGFVGTAIAGIAMTDNGALDFATGAALLG